MKTNLKRFAQIRLIEDGKPNKKAYFVDPKEYTLQEIFNMDIGELEDNISFIIKPTFINEEEFNKLPEFEGY